jgi:hypothetical protein
MTAEPQRLRLARGKGFNLQARSRASAFIPIVLHSYIRIAEYGDDALHVSIRDGTVLRGCNRAKLSRPARSMLVALCANPGRNFTREELIEIAWGDCPEGGPEFIEKRVDMCCQEIRLVCAAFGLVFSRTHHYSSIRPHATIEVAE